MFITSDLDRWFAREILVHEAALTRYLQRARQRPTDVPDLRQEIYVRVYESAAKAPPISPRAFLFQTARNLIIDRARRERIVSIDYTQDLDSLNVLIDEISPEQRLSARQELKRLSTALDQLSDDCRSVIWLRRVEGLSQKEAAARLSLPEGTLESHLCRGIRALMKMVLGGGTPDRPQATARGLHNESKHG
ncbi:RNA polymerase sigma factor [Steroidobacter flavus]|uniref:RNA polymerase sigma factor n=1 Tax=Steroidobacter flavus TaxID=1842136 RepID=A0ABV8T090_9GAMM